MERSMTLLPVVWVALSACSSPEPPRGLVCAQIFVAAGDRREMNDALASAGPGDCVVLGEGTYRGASTVPAGVALAAGRGERVELESGDAGDAVVTLEEGAALWGVEVVDAPGIGVLVRTATATLADVEVAAAGAAGIVVSCAGESCLAAGAEVVLRDTDISGCDLGLFASGARVTVTGGRIVAQARAHLTGGHGVVVTDGAELTLSGTLVADNEAVGVLVEGNGGTRAILDGAEVSRNRERGLWVQHLAATLAAPGVEVRGQSRFDGNRMAGVGLVASTGVIVGAAEITNTVLAPAVLEDTTLADVGDGLGVFAGSGAVRVEGATLANNARAQLLIDHGGEGIEILSATITAGAEQEGAGRQNTTATVSDPQGLVSQIPIPLKVSAPEIPVPAPVL
jgi:hypothetical protein